MRWPWNKKKEEQEDARHRAGLWGEKMAGQFLQNKGFVILGRRVRVGRRDELDLIARQKNVLVFVEVKTRRAEEFGRPSSAVNKAKKQALSRAAVHYLMRLKEKPGFFRFDVVEVVGEEDGEAPVIRHIENAFPLEGRYRISW